MSSLFNDAYTRHQPPFRLKIFPNKSSNYFNDFFIFLKSNHPGPREYQTTIEVVVAITTWHTEANLSESRKFTGPILEYPQGIYPRLPKSHNAETYFAQII